MELIKKGKSCYFCHFKTFKVKVLSNKEESVLVSTIPGLFVKKSMEILSLTKAEKVSPSFRFGYQYKSTRRRN